MQLITLAFTATLLIFSTINRPNNNHSTTGMYYYIVPNKSTQCKNDFGNGLSFFFEQVGGYGDKAEVEQVSKLLDIDLSIFQDVGYDPEDKVEVEKHWHDLNTFTTIVDKFIDKINGNPEYYKKVVHNPEKKKLDDELSQILYMKDTARAEKLRKILEANPFYYYPPDYGYLSEGRILKDLKTLKKTLECYRKNGVTKVRLEYM